MNKDINIYAVEIKHCGLASSFFIFRQELKVEGDVEKVKTAIQDYINEVKSLKRTPFTDDLLKYLKNRDIQAEVIIVHKISDSM